MVTNQRSDDLDAWASQNAYLHQFMLECPRVPTGSNSAGCHLLHRAITSHAALPFQQLCFAHTGDSVWKSQYQLVEIKMCARGQLCIKTQGYVRVD